MINPCDPNDVTCNIEVQPNKILEIHVMCHVLR